MRTVSTILLILATTASCSDGAVIYKADSRREGTEAVALHEAKVVSETNDTLVLDVSYTYDDSVPTDEVRLMVMPDHGYWSSRHATVSRGTHIARVSIGLSERNMAKDGVTESDTTMLRFRFEHYRPSEYVGSIWGTDVMYDKHWTLE